MKAFIVVFFLLGVAFAAEVDEKIVKYSECLAKNYDVMLSNVTFNQLVKDCVNMRPEYSALQADVDNLDKFVAETVDEMKQYAECQDCDCRLSIVGCISVRAHYACAETRRLGAVMQGMGEDKEVAKCMKLPVALIEKSVNAALNVAECYN